MPAMIVKNPVSGLECPPKTSDLYCSVQDYSGFGCRDQGQNSLESRLFSPG